VQYTSNANPNLADKNCVEIPAHLLQFIGKSNHSSVNILDDYISYILT